MAVAPSDSATSVRAPGDWEQGCGGELDVLVVLHGASVPALRERVDNLHGRVAALSGCA